MQASKIISKITGAVIVFVGLSDITADNIKSYEDFGLVWLEEAQKISKKSWETLNPTIRTDGSQIILTMNPDVAHDKHPIMSELLTMYKDDTLHIHANYYDNPFLGDDIVKQAELTKIHKPDEYTRVWLGIPDENMNNNIVKGFTSENIRPIFYQPQLDLSELSMPIISTACVITSRQLIMLNRTSFAPTSLNKLNKSLNLCFRSINAFLSS